jgi:hypothetical protein
LSLLFLTLFFIPPDLPPLPDPFAVELKIAEPKNEKLPLDSLTVAASLGNPNGVSFDLVKAFKRNVLEANGTLIRGQDYSSFSNRHGAVRWLHLLPRAWWKFGFDYKRTERAQTYQQTYGGTLAVEFPFNLELTIPGYQTEFFDSRRQTFFSLFPDATFNFHLLGYGQARTIFYYQPGLRNFLDFSLADQVGLSSILFFRPGIVYQQPENDLAAQLLVGSTIKKLSVSVEFVHNDRQPVRFDSLVFAQPFFESNPRLSPARYHPALKLKIRYSTLDIRFEHAKIDSFIYWTDTNHDSLFEPDNRDVSRDAVHINHTCQWRGFKNSLGLNYEKTAPVVDLLPTWTFTDSFSFSKKHFGFEAVGCWIDSRLWIEPRLLGSRSLPPIFNLSSQVNYTVGLFKFFFAVDNILGKKYEALPYRFHTGRRFSLGCCLTKAI